MRTKIELVVFDLGRVLIRLCDDHRHACRRAGIELSDDLPDLSPEQLRAIEQIIEQYDTGKIDPQTFCRQIAPFRGLTPEQAFAAHTAYLMGPYPGGDELIADIHAAKMKTACLSNTSDHHWRQMTDPADSNFLNLDRLTYRFASHLLGVMKPNPAIYEIVERETQIPPDRIVFFDDLALNITAAAKRGWHAQQIRTDADPIAQAREHLRRHGVRLRPPI